MFHVRGVFKIFLVRAPNCEIFYKRKFSGRANLKQIEEKNCSIGGPGACSFGKFLANAKSKIVLYFFDANPLINIPARKQQAMASIYPNYQDPEPAAEQST